MLSQSILKFLSQLAKNNDREWFQDHRDEFEAAKAEFQQFVSALVQGIAEFDSSLEGIDAAKCIFRIYRDTRFSKDKSPYKTHFGAHLSAAANKFQHRAGYYVHIEPGASMLGGGAYMPPTEWLRPIRNHIEQHGDRLKKIISAAAFKKHFGALEGESLKTAPQGFDPNHKYIDLLKRKSLVAVHKPSDKEVTSPVFFKQVLVTFKAVKPLDDFLNEALEKE